MRHSRKPTTRNTLTLHDALPISQADDRAGVEPADLGPERDPARAEAEFERGVKAQKAAFEFGLSSGWVSFGDRKSTRLNSSHSQISYAVFCLKKKKNKPLKNVSI